VAGERSVSARASLQSRVELYLLERRRLGFSGRNDAYALRSFARHVQSVSHRGPLTVEVMADWARRDSHESNDPHTWARRLKRLRTFMRWLQQFEPRTEVPDDAIFGRLPERQAPHIYSEQEVVDLLSAARRLGPAPGLRGIVFETLFGLIASTGLRVGEALSLRNMDVDLKAGMLNIHQTKFGKSRQVPMHPSTVDALRRYRWMRDLSGESGAEDAAFFIGTMRRLRPRRPRSAREAGAIRLEPSAHSWDLRIGVGSTLPPSRRCDAKEVVAPAREAPLLPSTLASGQPDGWRSTRWSPLGLADLRRFGPPRPAQAGRHCGAQPPLNA